MKNIFFLSIVTILMSCCESPGGIGPVSQQQELSRAEEKATRDAVADSSLDRIIDEYHVQPARSLEAVSSLLIEADKELRIVTSIIESTDNCESANKQLESHLATLRDLPAVQAKVILFLKNKSTRDTERDALKGILASQFNESFAMASEAVGKIMLKKDERWTSSCREKLANSLNIPTGERQ